jgi:hypothetical protein
MGFCAVTGDAVALEVGEMFRERRGRKPPARWRTIRAMTTTRRLDDREARDSAARRPQPKVERPTDRPLGPNVQPRWPAFFAARITSPTKLFGRLAPWLP